MEIPLEYKVLMDILLPLDHIQRTLTDFTIWEEMYGNGARITIVSHSI